MGKLRVGVLGSGNIGTDLLLKLLRSRLLEPVIVAGLDEASEGLRIARENGVRTSSRGIEDVLREADLGIVFDATGAAAHCQHAPRLKDAGIVAVDLTPAAIGPPVVPYVNLGGRLDAWNVNLITCGGQATIPLVWAISQVTAVEYAEIVSTVASRSAGPGTRQNIDEFTETTARSLEIVGGAKTGKAIIILNPADPPILMRNTVYVLAKDPGADAVRNAIDDMVRKIQTYVPGYRLKHAPDVEGDKITIQLEVAGAGDYLPRYSGNLDIMTAAAVAVGESFARERFGAEVLN